MHNLGGYVIDLDALKVQRESRNLAVKNGLNTKVSHRCSWKMRTQHNSII